MSADEFEPQHTVKDDENKSQNATLRRIEAYRDEIAEYQLAFAQNELSHEFSKRSQERAYYQLVRGFIQLLEPYLTDEEIPQADKYWNNVHLGSFDIESPPIIQSPGRGAMTRAMRDGSTEDVTRSKPQEPVEPKHFDVVGLRDFIAPGEPEWEVSWRVTFGPDVTAADLRREVNTQGVEVQSAGGRGKMRVTKVAQMPREVMDAAAREVQRFVRDIGMDIEIDEGEQQTKITRELLEEVDEWRRENIE